MTTAPPRALVVGSRGLLGAATCRELRFRGWSVSTVAAAWANPASAVRSLVEATRRVVGDGSGRWAVVWCAGAGVVGTTADALDAEVATLRSYLDEIGPLLTAATEPGVFFLASSGGGVHAGSSAPPFTEDTVPRPLAPYGVAKLAGEALLVETAARTGVRGVVGRIANLYGPGQDMAKAQGLITQLCKAHVQRRPSSIYVSLDTARDYVYVDDAARMVVAALPVAVERLEPGQVQVKLVASQRSTTIAMILGELRRLTRRAPQVTLAVSPLSRFQVRDLRFRSTVWPDLDDVVTTTLPAGVWATMEAVRGDLARADLARADVRPAGRRAPASG